MEDKTFVEKDLGPEAKLKVEYAEGKIKLTVTHVGKIGEAGAHIAADAALLVDAITDIIPGEWDDSLLDDLAKKMLSKKTGA